MLRAIGAVVLGYIVMVVVVFATFTGAYFAMGADGAFKPGSYDVSGLWLVASFVLGIVAAVAGGFVAAAIARGGKAPMVLAGIVLVLGLLSAIPVLMSDEPPAVREGTVGNIEAMQNARQPGWVALLNPFVGALGVVIGARLKGGAK